MSSTRLRLPDLHTCTVAVIGLGYVGLPLSLEFAKPQACLRTGAQMRRRVIGFDINQQRLRELRAGYDRTNETTAEELSEAEYLEFTAEPVDLEQADVFVVTVPTPIDNAKRPDLTPLEMASGAVGRAMKARAALGAITLPLVIFESTVYPGATEEVCVPILEKESSLHFNKDFYCGYSPERINPGDTSHKLTTIIKVTSGSTSESAAWVDCFYGSIIRAGTHLAPSLKVAEAAKVIENTQRDLNIALVNELAIIFRKLEINTHDVLKAAGTKWNFLQFWPGLVGGHCIGVDPYYLTYKAEQLGYHPQVVLAGRRINDGMGRWVVEQLVIEMARKGLRIGSSRVLVLGFAFKENCPDLRNTRVVDIVKALQSYTMEPEVVDPWVNVQEAQQEFGQVVLPQIPTDKSWSAVVIAVAHREFTLLSIEQWQQMVELNGVLCDLKGILPPEFPALRI